MRTLETIAELTRDELEQFRNETLNEFHIYSEELPFSVFAALRNTPNVVPVSNGMFYILLHHFTGEQSNSCRFGSTTQWLDNENIKGWILIPFQETNYILFLTNEQREILERIRDREHADIYTEMLEKCESDIQKLEDEIKSILDYNSTIKKRKTEMKDSVEIIKEIIKEGAISDANLRLLVNKIIIFEKDKKLSIKIKLNAKFQRHKDCYDENGNLTEKAFIA